MEHQYGTASTGHASLYLKKLCRHFSHKVDTEFDDHQGTIRFSFGTCELTADATRLQLHCQAATDQMATLRDVIERHLVRFATRDTLTVSWQQPVSLPARCSGNAADATDNESPASAP